MVDLVIATRRNTEVQKEAEAIFRKDACAPSASEGNVPSAAPFTGRILPCLLATPVLPHLGKDKKPARTPRSEDPSSTTALMKPRVKQSRKTLTLGSKRIQSSQWSLSVSDEFADLSDLEILSLIERARTEIARRKEAGKDLLRAEIEAKLKNAGLDLGDLFASERKTARAADKSKESNSQSGVAPKYKNHMSGETWSGRGRAPRWVIALLQERELSLEDFKQSDEFLIA
jgi:DNA-binding protein H-NS